MHGPSFQVQYEQPAPATKGVCKQSSMSEPKPATPASSLLLPFHEAFNSNSARFAWVAGGTEPDY
jgi:hypothetical protein